VLHLSYALKAAALDCHRRNQQTWADAL